MKNLARSLYVAFWLAWGFQFYRWLLLDHGPLRMPQLFYVLGMILCLVMLNVFALLHLKK